MASLNYIKEIEEGLHMDLEELLSEKDEYEKEQYDLRIVKYKRVRS